MNSIKSYISRSKQFKNVAKKLFNNNYKIDHYATRSFFIKKSTDKLITQKYKLENDDFHISENIRSKWMSNSENKFNKITKKYERLDFPYIFLTNVNIVPMDSMLICQAKEYQEFMDYLKNPNLMPYDYYLKLKEKDHIVAWTVLFENHINHLAFQVDDIEECLDKVKIKLPEYEINNINNPIEISSDKNLKQFSLKAETSLFNFNDGMREVPYTFVEFVERNNGRRGFETKNAQGIFESTNK